VGRGRGSEKKVPLGKGQGGENGPLDRAVQGSKKEKRPKEKEKEVPPLKKKTSKKKKKKREFKEAKSK